MSTGRLCASCRKPKCARGGQPGRALTFREMQVVRLVAEAKPTKVIAFDLHLAEGTIKEYLNRIFRKTGARSRTDLAMRFIRGEFVKSQE